MKRKLTCFMLSCVMVLSLVFLFNLKDTHAATISNTPIQNVDEISKPYTDSDSLMNISGKKLIDYPDLRATSQGVQNADDPITSIVPKQLFAARGTYLHMGNEYGFYVHTRQVNQAGDSGSIKPSINSNLVTVFVFNLVRVFSSLNATYTIEVQPLFCYDYAYILPQYYYGSYIFYHWQPYYENWDYGEIVKYKSKGFVANGMADIVIGLPDGRYYNDYDGDHYVERWQINARYMVQEMALSYKFTNVNQLNPGDSGYTPQNDNCAFFNKVLIDYSGRTLHSPQTDLITFIKHIASAISYNGIGSAFSLINFIADAVESSLPDTESNTETLHQSSYNYRFEAMPEDKDGQIATYGKLMKTLACSYTNSGSSTNPVMFKPATVATDFFRTTACFHTTVKSQTRIDVDFDATIVFKSTSSVLGLQKMNTPTVKCGDAVYY